MIINKKSLYCAINPKVNLTLKENCVTNDFNLYQLNEVLTNFYRQDSPSYLLEDATTAVNNYIQKSNQKISQIWNKFVQDNSKSQDKISKIIDPQTVKNYYNSGFMMRLPQNYLIPRVVNWQKIADNKVQLITNATYIPMKQYLGSVQDYIQQYFRGVYINKEKSLRQSMINSVFTKAQGGEIIGRKEVIAPYTFLLNYQNQVNLIQNDINILNTSISNIQKFVSNLSTNEATKFFNDLHILINEAELQKSVAASKPTVAVYDNNDNIQYNANKLKGEAKPKSDSIYLKNYLTANNQIISGKIAACSKLKNQCIRLLNYYIKLQGKNKKPNQNMIVNKTIINNQRR